MSKGYILHLEPLPNWGPEPDQRLRAALKRLLRNHGLRCVTARPAGEEGQGKGCGPSKEGDAP